MPYLSEMLATNATPAENPLIECIIFSSLWGRIVSYQHRYDNDMENGFWLSHRWLAETLKHRASMLLKSWSLSNSRADPLLLFTNLIAHGAIMKLGELTMSIPWSSDEYQHASLQYTEMTNKAAQDIVDLASSFSKAGIFKVCSQIRTSQKSFVFPTPVIFAVFILHVSRLGSPIPPDPSFALRQILGSAERTKWNIPVRLSPSSKGA
jgi:hypothetical protein